MLTKKQFENFQRVLYKTNGLCLFVMDCRGCPIEKKCKLAGTVPAKKKLIKEFLVNQLP